MIKVAPGVSSGDIAAFQRDGAVCLRSVFDTEWLDSLAEGVRKNFADPGPSSTQYTPEGKPGGFYDDYCNWERIDEYRRFIFDSPAAAIVAKLLQSEEVRIFHEHVLVKEPGTLEETPWHHDQPYYCVDGNQLCSIWLPLDPVPISAGVRFVAGSHNWGKLFYPRLFVSHENYDYDIEDLETVPDIDAAVADYNVLHWDMQPGDCIVFHMRTLHSAPGTPNITTRRRGFSTRWLGDDAVFAKRPKTSPPFPGLNLQPGESMSHPFFPLAWPRTT